MNIAYVRVSTVDQNEDRQIEALKNHKIEKYFVEKASAKDTNRREFQKMMEFAREGDTIYVEDFSRMARSVSDLLRIVDELKNRDIKLVSLKENLNTSTPTGKLMLTMIGAIDEFERANLLERQREGIALAKERGAYTGRKPKKTPDNIDEYFNRWKNHEMSKSEAARQLGVSRPTVDRWFSEYRSNTEIDRAIVSSEAEVAAGEELKEAESALSELRGKHFGWTI